MATVGWDVSCMQLTRPFPTHPASKRHVHFISTCVGCGLHLPLIGGSYSLCLSLSEWALGFACAQLSWTFLPGPMSRCSTCGTHHEQTTKSRSRWSIFLSFFFRHYLEQPMLDVMPKKTLCVVLLLIRRGQLRVVHRICMGVTLRYYVSARLP